MLAGLLLATYVSNEPRAARDAAAADEQLEMTADERRFTFGGLLSFLAIGCPTCNKLVVLALGSSGAITWFEPLQPIMAVVGIALLGYALRRRLLGEISCPVPAART